MLVIGATNSSNSQRLREVAERSGAPAYLIPRAEYLDWRWFEGVTTLGITAGASAPEVLVQELLGLIGTRYELAVEEQCQRRRGRRLQAAARADRRRLMAAHQGMAV